MIYNTKKAPKMESSFYINKNRIILSYIQKIMYFFKCQKSR